MKPLYLWKQLSKSFPKLINVSCFRLAAPIMKTSKLPTNAKKIKELDLEDSSLYKLSKSSGYVAALEETLEGVDQEAKDQLYLELKDACITQLKYLHSHLPFDRPLIMAAAFADPKKRNLGSLPDLAVSAANELKRFTAAEVTKVRVQAQSYQALPSHLVPEFDSMEDRVDQWWTKIFKVLEEQMSEPPMELIRLVKFLLILPHGQATVEGGFSTTKAILDNRASLGDKSVKGQKLVISAVRACGGADKVPVTKEVLAAVKASASKYKADMEKEQEEKRKAEENAKGEAEAKKIREEKEEKKRSWESKKKKVEDKLKTLEDQMENQDNVMSANLRRAQTVKDDRVKLSCLGTIKECQEKLKEKRKEQSKLQEELKKLLERKPKN